MFQKKFILYADLVKRQALIPFPRTGKRSEKSPSETPDFLELYRRNNIMNNPDNDNALSNGLSLLHRVSKKSKNLRPHGNKSQE